jgi:hypothetical protein
MGFGFANPLSETLTLHIPTVRPRSIGAETGLTSQRRASMNCLVGVFNGLATGLQMLFARKISDLRVL